MVEILQDDKIRDQLNHISNNQPQTQPDQNSNSNRNNNTSRQNSRNQNGHANHDDDEPQFDDEEEMLEMLEMQEECRLEMMKFYIQSQNPSLFEEIYHDVSYPDAKKPPSPTRQPASSKPSAESSKAEPAAEAAPTATDAAANTSSDSIKDLIVNNLNPDVDDFVPNKLAELSLDAKK